MIPSFGECIIFDRFRIDTSDNHLYRVMNFDRYFDELNSLRYCYSQDTPGAWQYGSR